MEITIAKASKEWGIPRPTIYDKIAKGVFSRLSNGKVDTSEMLRVFGEPRPKVKDVSAYIKTDIRTDAGVDTVDASTVLENEYLKAKIADMEQRIAELKEDKRTADGRVDVLLEQTSKMAETIKLLEAPKLNATVEPEPKKGFFKRLLS